MNLCDDPHCRDSNVDAEKSPDLPAPHVTVHAVFKTRMMIHLCEFGKMDSAARSALKKARMAFNDAAELMMMDDGPLRR